MSGTRFWVMAVILATATIAYSSLRHGERIAPHQPLAMFPMQLGTWNGMDVELPPRVADATGADQILNRAYVSQSGELFLYIGYYRSQRTGDTIHSPKNCLPGSGWQPVRSEYVQVRTPEGRMVPVALYLVEKGLQRSLVIYWYQSHGRMIASEYWAKFYMVADAIRINRTDAALVRVSVPVAGDEAVARQQAVSFVEGMLPQLNTIIPK